MTCTKIKHLTRKDAKLAIKRFGSRFKNSTLSAYWCDTCAAFHLTSSDMLGKQIARGIARNGKGLK